MEMKYLSGFSADKSSITQMDIIKRVEDGNKMLVLYFDEVNIDSMVNVCFYVFGGFK